MNAGTYIVVLGTSESGATGWKCLGAKLNSGGTAGTCVVSTFDVSKNDNTWLLVPVPGADGFLGFYLQHQASNLVANFGGGENNDIQLSAFGAPDVSFFLRLDHTGDGWVAINNANDTLVVDAAGENPAVGARVVAYKWNKGHGKNQLWRFINTALLSGT